MEVQEVLIAGNKEVIVNFALKENNKLLGEIVIRPTVSKEKAVNPLALVGARMLNMEEASRYAGGYSDPARLVTSFAGVAGSPDNNGISVHGNAPQSLSWRLEGIEINSPNHFTDAFCMGTGVVSAFLTELDKSMTCYHNKLLPLGVMPVLTLSNTRLCDIDRDLTAGGCFQKLRKAPSLIPIHFERKRHLVRGQIGEIGAI